MKRVPIVVSTLCMLAACDVTPPTGSQVMPLAVTDEATRLHLVIGGGNDQLIDYADFSIDGGPAARDDYAPFETTVDKRGLMPGSHTVNVDVAVNLLGEVSSVTRTVTFDVAAGLPESGPDLTGMPCPAAIHDAHTAVWKDGKTYLTWHPQIDPRTGCHFDHEHGSDPASFSGNVKPVFNLFEGKYSSATGKTLPAEPHKGFKVIVAEQNGISMMIIQHITGSETMRLCQQHHTTHEVFANAFNGEILGDFAIKGDFGKPVAQTGFGKVAPMRHNMCPQLADTKSYGHIHVPVASRAGENTGYESWRLSTNGLKVPLKGLFMLRTDEPYMVCNDARNLKGEYTCAKGLSTTENGVPRDNIERWVDFYNEHGIDTTLPGRSTGNFCTDYTGTVLLACGDPNAVPQYVKPGAKFAFTGRWSVPEANIINAGPNAFKFAPGEPQNRDFNLGTVQGPHN